MVETFSYSRMFIFTFLKCFLLLFCFWWDVWGLVTGFCSKSSIEGRKVPLNRPIDRSSFLLQFAVGELVKHYSSLTPPGLPFLQVLAVPCPGL